MFVVAHAQPCGTKAKVVSQHKTENEADVAFYKSAPFDDLWQYVIAKSRKKVGGFIPIITVKPLYMTALGL